MELFFEFERLDAYQLALDYQLVTDEIARRSETLGRASVGGLQVGGLQVPAPGRELTSGDSSTEVSLLA
jgi:hypothetical protein